LIDGETGSFVDPLLQELYCLHFIWLATDQRGSPSGEQQMHTMIRRCRPPQD
jgi:hypothetical protein